MRVMIGWYHWVVGAECALGGGMRLPSPSRSPGEQPSGDSRHWDQILRADIVIRWQILWHCENICHQQVFSPGYQPPGDIWLLRSDIGTGWQILVTIFARTIILTRWHWLLIRNIESKYCHQVIIHKLVTMFVENKYCHKVTKNLEVTIFAENKYGHRAT